MYSVLDKDRDVRNFRSWYYENLGLRGVEQRKALDLLLKDDDIDLDKLKTFCLQFGLPAIRRPIVWKLLLGILPRHQQSHKFIKIQQSEQVEHLLSTLKIIRKLSEKNDSVPSQIVQMYLLNEGEMGFMQPSEELERRLKVLTSIAKLMCEIFEDIEDCFWATTKFFKLQKTFDVQLKSLVELFEQRLTAEDPDLCRYLCSIGAWKQLPCQRWFESFFAEDLNDLSLERIWDRVIAGSCTILAYVAVAILVVFRQILISKKSSEPVLRFLAQIPQESCETIIAKAMDLNIKYAVAPVSPVTKTTGVHNGNGKEFSNARSSAPAPT
ncbi:TBC1 domain family member 7-like isoform X2 [Dendronephthya gigantea]|uniref:TBC1 domain family member 7-like isoform X2 n=1 Tax=Dendronephthya gigantea TaxID=151771 RepID=UPI00106CA951|nr:TBC1 domain family member 7-like isoform X2 [Dendronephthya gigantea]